jgi:hypothetical protein
MWRAYLIYVIDALKVATLGAIAFGAWFLAAWILNGDFGIPFWTYEPRGLSTGFLALFFGLLVIGVAVATPLLWGWRRKPGDSTDYYRGNEHDGI